MYIGIHVTYPVFLSDVKKTEFSQQILKNTQISNLMKLRPVAAEVFHADGRKDGQTYIHTDRRTDRRRDRQTEGQTDGGTDGGTDIRRDRQKDRKTDGHDEAKSFFEILRTRLKTTDDSSIGN